MDKIARDVLKVARDLSSAERTAKVEVRIREDQASVSVLEAYVGNFQVNECRKKASVFLKKVNKAFDMALGILSENGISAQVSLDGVSDVWVVSTGSAGTAFRISAALSYTYGADYDPNNLNKVIPKALKVGFKSVGIAF